jgi:hypothetical protein
MRPRGISLNALQMPGASGSGRDPFFFQPGERPKVDEALINHLLEFLHVAFVQVRKLLQEPGVFWENNWGHPVHDLDNCSKNHPCLDTMKVKTFM